MSDHPILATVDLGDVVDLTAAFTRRSDSTPIAADIVTCTVTPKGRASVELDVTPGDVGAYTAAYEPTVSGVHTVTWRSTGNVVGRESGRLIVQP